MTRTARTRGGLVALVVSTDHVAFTRELVETLSGVRQPATSASAPQAVVDSRGDRIGWITAAADSRAPRGPCPVFEVDDSDGRAKAVLEHGGSVTPLQDLDGQAVWLVTDPAGSFFGIKERQRSSRSTPGHLYVELIADDLAMLEPFYGAVLGIRMRPLEQKTVSTAVIPDWFTYRLLVRDGVAVGAAVASSYFGNRAGDAAWVAYFEVDRIDLAVSRAVEHGCRVLVPPSHSPTGSWAMVEDLFGARWGIGTTDPISEASDVVVDVGGGRRASVLSLLPVAEKRRRDGR